MNTPAILAALAAMAMARCGGPTGTSKTSAGDAGNDAAVPDPEPFGAPVAPHPGMSARYDVVAAADCDGHGVAVSPAQITLERDARGRWLTRAPWGCGCPTGPVFTLVYVAGTSPLQVRLCRDQDRDPCERGCGMPVAWDLRKPLASSSAIDVEVMP